MATREVQAPDGPAYAPIVELFGPSVVAPDGTLDRQAIAQIVFNDPTALKALTTIVHPLVGERMMARLAAEAQTDHIVILDVPLLVEGSASSKSGAAAQHIIVVDCPEDVAVERLVRFRDFTEADARARMSAQASRQERLVRADFVIDNSGDLDHLDTEVARCWTWLESLTP